MRIGSDPEIFLVNKVGKHIAINGFINAGKEDPMQVPDMATGFTLQEDNVALELGHPPASTSEELSAYLEALMLKARSYIPEDLDFSRLSCTVFTDDQLQHPRSRIFGCEPDYCAYTHQPNPRPHPKYEGMRSAGGHIHVETTLNPYDVAKSMDLFLGVPSVLMDKGEERKQLYGKAGAMRFKSYGVEYRTLSNFWIFNKEHRDWVWRNTERALNNMKAHEPMEGLVRECINTNNRELAWSLVGDYNLEVI